MVNIYLPKDMEKRLDKVVADMPLTKAELVSKIIIEAMDGLEETFMPDKVLPRNTEMNQSYDSLK